MFKKLLILLPLIVFMLFPAKSNAYTGKTYVTITNPVRGSEGWRNLTQTPVDVPIALYQESSRSGLPSNWLLRYDAVEDATISAFFNKIVGPDILVSLGGLLEITPNLTKTAKINYPNGNTNRTFLSGYTQPQRILLIDAFMDSFKKQFGFFPRVVGAWHLDSYSLAYLENKYSVQTAMIIDDQYTSDFTRLWGGYLGSPYFPDKNNSLVPSSSFENRINIPITRFAQRDLYNLVNSKNISLYSVQPNDYFRLGLTTAYFDNLLSLYTQKGLNKFTYFNVGLENDRILGDYLQETKNIYSSLKSNQQKYNIQFTSLEMFGDWMKSMYPESSPVYFYRTGDPTDTQSGEVVWYQTPFYRIGLKSSNGQTKIIDFRVYNREVFEDYYATPNQSYSVYAEIPAVVDSTKYPGTEIVLNIDLENFSTTYNDLDDIWRISLSKEDQKITFTQKEITFSNIQISEKNFQDIKETKSETEIFWTVDPKTPFKDQDTHPIIFWVLVAMSTIVIIKKLYHHKLSIKSISLITGFVCVAIVSLTVIKSGQIYSFGMGFWGPNGHDAIFHLSIIEKFSQNTFNLNHPQLAGEILTNYHFVFDYLSSIIVQIFHISAITFYFRIAPIIFGISLVILLNKLMVKWKYSSLETFLGFILVFLSGSFGFIPKIITNQNIFSGESAFWANQSASLFLNPPFVLSIILLLLFLINLPQAGQTKPNQFIKLVFFGAILAQTKVYAFILLCIALFLTRKIKLAIVVGFVGALITFPFSSFSGSPFFFDPLWFTKSLFASLDRFFWPKLVQAWQAYEATGNFPKLLSVNIFALIVFITGNLGVRILGVSKLFKEKKSDQSKTITSWIIIIGLILPILIIQKVNPWNTIQFMYYSLFFLGLLTARVISNLVLSIRNILFRIIVLVVIISLATATSIGTFKDYLSEFSASRISFTELRALDLLKDSPGGIVLSPLFDKLSTERILTTKPLYAYVSTAYISALSGQPEFLSDTINLDITGYDYKQRAKDIQRFYNTADSNWAKNFLAKNGIKYIYETPLKRMKIDPNSISLTKIFDSGEINIYQTN